MCPSSWKLYLDDFPFLGSSLAHLEPKLELFEFWGVDDYLSHIYLPYMRFLPSKFSYYPSRPVPVPDLFCKYPTRPVPK